MKSYLILDIENNSSIESKEKGRKAGTPLLGDKIVAIGMKNQSELRSSYLYPNDLKEFHIDEDVLVLHNASHDLQWFWHLDSVQAFFKRGGKIWDTALVEYVLTGQQSKYPSLRDIAVNQYGCPAREKTMEKLLFKKEIYLKELHAQYILSLVKEPYTANAIREEMKQIENYKQVSDLPRAVVLKDVENDVLDTEQVYLQQLELSGNSGQLNLIELQNDALLATIEMTMNGMKIDLDVLQANKLELEAKLESKKIELGLLIQPWWKA